MNERRVDPVLDLELKARHVLLVLREHPTGTVTALEARGLAEAALAVCEELQK